MKILVLGGGDSPEREVSLKSAANVAAAARQAGFEVLEADPSYESEILRSLPKEVPVFPILHGAGGEDGVIQKQLEDLGLMFLGSDSRVSKECFDKWLTRQKLQEAGVSMPEAEHVSRESYYKSGIASQHHVLKVTHGGSSIGTLIVRKGEENPDDAKRIFGMENDAVLEELIEGHEITVPVLDGKALPVIEIIPPSDEE